MEFKWKVLGVVVLGSLMGSIDSTVLLIAFPSIARELHADLVTMVWVIMVYILMGTALVLSFGRLSDLKGRKRLFIAGFAVFVLGSLLCGLALTGLELVLFRGLQGIGGAVLVSNSFAILSDAFPPNERGRAFGMNSVVWATGAVVGFFLGGFILTVASWRWIFFINIPIGVAAIALAAWILRESVTPNPRDTFDFPAATLFTATLTLFLLGVTEGILNGWGAAIAALPLLLSLPSFAAFLYWEGRVSHDPILPFALFRSWLFSAALIAAVLQGIALFATNFLLMVYFQGIRGLSVLEAAYLLIPLSIALGVVGPIGGRLSDRYGARVLSTIGLLVQGLALFGLATLAPSTSLWSVGAWEAMLGVGGGLFFPANTSSIMAGVPREKYGVGSGVMMTLRNSAMALSFAVGLVAVTARLPAGVAPALFGGSFGPAFIASLGLTPAALEQVFLSGMHLAFEVSGGLFLAGALVSALRGRERRTGEVVVYHRATVRPPVRTGETSPPPSAAAPPSPQS
jgi:EmrB/QacA subfamily drug resistance transporter